MTVAAGLGERTDQAFFALTGTTQAAGSQGRVSGKETEGSEFQQLFEGLVKEEEEMAEERLPKNTVVDEDILSQLILLYPELSAMTSAQISTMFSLDQETTPLPLAQEPISFPSDRKPDPWSPESTDQKALANSFPSDRKPDPWSLGLSVEQEATAVSVDQEATAMSVGQEPNPFSLDQGLIAGGEAGKELPNAVQTGGGDWPTLNAANEAFVTAMTAGPAEAGLAVARLAEAGPAEVRGVEATATNGNTAVDHETLTGTLPAPEVTMAVQENEESSVIQTKVAVVADEIEAGGQQRRTGLNKAETAGTAPETKTSATPPRTEPAGHAGKTGEVRPAEGESVATSAREITEMVNTLQTEEDATHSESVRTEKAVTGRQRVRPEEADGHDGLEVRSVMPERQPKTVLKAGRAKPNDGWLGQTFSQMAGEAIHHKGGVAGTVASPEPFAPVIAREDLAAQIVRGARLMVKDGVTKIQIQLEPAELGKLELSLVVERDMVAARFVAETQGVQSLIEANLPQLRAALEEAGMQVDLLQVSVQTGTGSQQPNQNMAGGDQFQKRTGWNPAIEMFVVEEPIFGEEAWHGMINLRI